MKVYTPIEGLLGGRRRRRRGRGRFTAGLLGIVSLGMVAYWFLSTYQDHPAEARTDRLISLGAPDFTEVLSDVAPADWSVSEEAREPQNMPRPYQAEGRIRRNQTLFASMVDEGVEGGSIQHVVASLDGIFDFRRSQPGDRWEARLDDERKIVHFRYRVSQEEIYEAWRETDDVYLSERVEVPTEILVVGFGGTVLTSVNDALAEAGEGAYLSGRFMEIFRWDFDLSSQAQLGDTFRLVVEKVLLDGEFVRYGRILAAEYTGQNANLRAFFFERESGTSGFFTETGQALRRNFLQTPLNYRRMSSPFTLRRYHPVLQRYRPHLGVDYAAASGTPVWTIASGEVTFARERGGSGNLVHVNHGNGYVSTYAHLLRFADGIRSGVDVSQGQIIGYVGSTGLSTGPHLHFGMKYRGDFMDPLEVESEREPALEGTDLQAYQSELARLTRELEAIEVEVVDLSGFADVYPDDDAFDELPSDFGIVDEDGNAAEFDDVE